VPPTCCTHTLIAPQAIGKQHQLFKVLKVWPCWQGSQRARRHRQARELHQRGEGGVGWGWGGQHALSSDVGQNSSLGYDHMRASLFASRLAGDVRLILKGVKQSCRTWQRVRRSRGGAHI
jgi:hypothetical protein